MSNSPPASPGKGRKPQEKQFDLTVEYVPVAEDDLPAFERGMNLLLQWLHEVEVKHPEALEGHNKENRPQL